MLTNICSSILGKPAPISSPKALDGRKNLQVLPHGDAGPQDVELGAHAQALADLGHLRGN